MTLLEDRLGATALTITLGGQVLTLDDVGPVTIRHGRQNLDSQPDAATCTLSVYADALTQLPTIGTDLTVELGASAGPAFGLAGAALTAARPRFGGTVTDPAARLPGDPTERGTVTVTAVSRRARLGNTYVGDTPWPAELDGARAARILGLIPAGLITTGPVDAGQRTVLARDVDRQPALGLLDQLANDSGGQLVELRDGRLCWQDSDHRRALAQLLSLPASAILSPARWAQQLGGLVNDATIGYGAADPQATYRITDPASTDPVTGQGPLAVYLATQLATLADATAMATLLVGRRGRPSWALDALQVDLLTTVATATAALLLQAEVGNLLGVTGLPAAGPMTNGKLWLEGWTETISRTSWRQTLLVAGYGRGGTPIRWTDVPAGLTWADVPTDLSWLGAYAWQP